MNPAAILNAERRRTRLSPSKEKAFQAWYKAQAKKAGIDPNPDNPLHKYDYRGAFNAGDKMVIDKSDSRYHWSSKFKDEDHPNRYVSGVDTTIGKKAIFGKVKAKMPLISKGELKDKIQSLKTFNGKVMTPWMKRAWNHPELHTKDNESVQSTSMQDTPGGKEKLFPSVRLRGPGLEKMNTSREGVVNAFKESLKRKDYIEFDTPEEASKFAGEFSNALGKRGQNRKKNRETNNSESNLKQGYLIK